MSRDDNVLCVPLIHLRHTATEDLLATACESVGAGDGISIDAPHMNVSSSTGDYITLHSHTVFKSILFFMILCDILTAIKKLLFLYTISVNVYLRSAH